jgi:hypothetical protein
MEVTSPVPRTMLSPNIRTHVMRDLQPYVCTFKDCSLRLFSSRHEWFEHELVMHRKLWRCNKCQDECRSSDDFREHLNRNHPGSFSTDNQLKTLMIHCEHSVLNVSPSDCPLCDEWEFSLRGLNAGVENLVTIDHFKKHLGKHLERLALFALPRPGDEERERDEAKSGVTENVSEGGSNTSLESDEGIPERPFFARPNTATMSVVASINAAADDSDKIMAANSTTLPLTLIIVLSTRREKQRNEPRRH